LRETVAEFEAIRSAAVWLSVPVSPLAVVSSLFSHTALLAVETGESQGPMEIVITESLRSFMLGASVDGFAIFANGADAYRRNHGCRSIKARTLAFSVL
jgi:hypothetical protein